MYVGIKYTFMLLFPWFSSLIFVEPQRPPANNLSALKVVRIFADKSLAASDRHMHWCVELEYEYSICTNASEYPCVGERVQYRRAESSRPQVTPQVTTRWCRYPPLHSLAFLCERMREHGLVRDEHRDFVEDMQRLRAIRGKTRPQKGHGRRAQHRAA